VASPSSLSQEGQAALGAVGDGWRLTLHWAGVTRSSGGTAAAPVIYGLLGSGGALAGEVRLGLVWRASVAVVSWEDQLATQLEAAAAWPIGDHLSLEAGWRGQRLDGTTAGAWLAGLAWRGPWTLSLRAEYGRQRRPWDLEVRALYGLPEELRAALRLEASAPLGAGVRGWLGGDLERWRDPSASPGTPDPTAVRVAAGLLFSF
jgi:hypothetical protein